MAVKEITRLGHWVYDPVSMGNLLANTEWRPTALSGEGELETNEVAEVLATEIRSPRTSTGAVEPLEYVNIVLDDTEIKQYISLCGRHDALTAPPRQHTFAGEWVTFGDGLVDALRSRYPGLAWTTLKYRRSVRIVAKAGAGDITQPFSITLWGYRYKEEELARIVDTTTLDPSIMIRDRTTGRTLSISKSPISINFDSWDRLPGGPKQDKPIIMPFFRWARNSQATTPNTEYQFRFDTGFVAAQEQDLYFPFDRENTALWIKGLGARAATNLKYVWITNTGDVLHKEHPKGKILVSTTNNPIHFGAAQPLWPDNIPLYYAVPRFANDSLLLYKDLGYVAMQDNGTAVAANSVYIALNGVIFELPTA